MQPQLQQQVGCWWPDLGRGNYGNYGTRDNMAAALCELLSLLVDVAVHKGQHIVCSQTRVCSCRQVLLGPTSVPVFR